MFRISFMTDSIGDMITKIRNASTSKKELVVFPLSKKTLAIARALERAGFLEVIPEKSKKFYYKQIEAKLVYVGDTPRFKGARRISSISKRVYKKIKNTVPVKSGFGSLIMSTPKGILTEKEAKKENVGGEALFQIW
ncbi:MAG: 30S ribosomal protein S8 [Parcubacteria group bacterium GW2011_GWA2_44_15]|nr:MAG: 30S ribosomal protein S8 [Parcubacteria group bacterium GW2011_GWA2_44_15]